MALLIGDGMRPMLPGGIRRVIVPASLGSEPLAALLLYYCVAALLLLLTALQSSKAAAAVM